MLSNMWELPQPGVELSSWKYGILTTGPAGKSLLGFWFGAVLNFHMNLEKNDAIKILSFSIQEICLVKSFIFSVQLWGLFL